MTLLRKARFYNMSSVIMKKLICLIIPCCLFLLAGSLQAAKDARFYLNQASQYYNQGDYKQAEQAFDKLIQMQVKLHHDFYYFYGKTLYENGHYDQAEQQLGKFLQAVDSDNKYFSDARYLQSKARKNKAHQAAPKTDPDVSKKQLKRSLIPDMVRIPADSFIMGSNHGSADQKPPHKITINKDFAIGKYEITFDQYDAYAKETGQTLPDDEGWGRGNYPVINVSMADAKAYARWLSKKTGRQFRLPTEAEWEFVARTGIKGQLGFNDIVGTGDANCDGCRYFWESARTVEVGSYDPNKYGIYDIFGNVWEWTCSLYTRRYDGKEQYCADDDELEGQTIVVRGGSWDSAHQILRAYVRLNNFPTYTSNQVGFRLVEDIADK